MLILVTEDVSHLSMGWLKFVAPLKHRTMSVTDDVSQSPIGWLKEEARSKRASNVVTDDTFQVPIGLSNQLHPWKTPFIFSTDEVSQRSNG